MAYDTKLPHLLTCFAFLFVISYASAQSCAPHHVAVCAGIIPDGTPVYVPPFLSIDLLEIYATGIVSLLNYAGVVEPCHSYALQLTCGSWLRPCLVVGNETLPIPHEPCLNMCWTYYNSCANVYPYNSGDPTLPIGVGLYFPTGSAPLDCSKPIYDVWAGNVTYYQPGDYVVTDPKTNQNLSVSCSMSTPIAVPAPTYCESPLELTSYPTTGAPSCAFSCPVPSLSDSEYTNVKIMQGFVGWLSWSLSAMLILMLLFNPKTRDFPRNLVIMVACAANIAAGAIVLPTYAGYDNIWCGGSNVYLIPNGDVTGNDQYGLPIVDWNTDETFLSVESSACTFQGAMLQFGFLAAVFWWVLIAFNMTLELYVGRYLPLQAIAWKWSRFGVYLLIGWGLPFILMVIPAAAGRIKFPPAGSYCFVTNEDNYAWSLTFWFIPVGLSLLFGVTLFIAALIRVAFLLVNLKKVMKLVVLYLRLLLFIFLYLMQFVFLFAYQIQVAKDKNDIDQGYSDYYNCLILATDSCSLSESVSNYNLVMLKAWAISSLGTLLFLVFISWDVLKFWYNVFKALGLVFVKRDAQSIFSVLNLFAYQSSHTTLVSGTSNSLTVTGVEDEEEEMRSVEDRSKHNRTTEEEEEEDNDSSSTESSD